MSLCRTYDAYGKETTPVEVENRLYREDQARMREQAMKEQARDRNGIAMPDGWAVYFDGELVFSVSPENWETIGAAIKKIMETE